MAGPSPILRDLARKGLLRPGAQTGPGGRGPGVLLTLCEAGALEGGLSLALDVTPDEAFGPLCAATGGQSSQLRVLDVRKEPFELRVSFEGREESWDVPDVAALVHNLNDLLRDDPSARAIAVLGEWEDALQLWCVPKRALGGLFEAEYFSPRNEDDLRRL